MTGEIGILNVGAGDTKLTFDPNKPDDMKTAAKVVTDMIKRGFIILIESGTDPKDGQPLYKRVHEFRKDTFEYIVAGDVPSTEKKDEPRQPSRRGGSARADSAPKKAVHVTKTRGIAIGRTAGG